MQISTRYALIEEAIAIPQSTEKRQPLSHVWWFDRSGSMGGEIRALVDQLAALMPKIPVGDILSIGWFSGEGKCEFIVKGFRVQNDTDVKHLQDTILRYNSTVGTTCFSEALQSSLTAFEDLSSFSSRFMFSLFTDGYPVVSNLDREMKEIERLVALVGAKVIHAQVVGYGDHYNRELLESMARQLNTTVLHANQIENYIQALEEIVGLDANTIEIDVKKYNVYNPPTEIFTVTNETIVPLTQKDGIVKVPVTPNKQSLYVVVESDQLNFPSQSYVKNRSRGVYAAALLFAQRGRIEDSIDILSSGLGEKRLVNSLFNAYTNSEYGLVAHAMRDAMRFPRYRLVDGFHRGYRPDANTFCILDLFDLLLADPEAKFYPGFGVGYRRISRQTKPKDDSVKFSWNTTSGFPLSNAVWHEKRLNLSLLTMISGSVAFRDAKQAESLGLAATFPCSIYRTYTMIFDGKPNVTNLHLSFSAATADRLKAEGIQYEEVSPGVFRLDLTTIPVINKAISASTNISAIDLAESTITEIQLQAKQKVLNHLLKEMEEVAAPKTGSLSAGQEQFLLDHYIKNGIFQPPSETQEATDEISCHTFDIKVKSFSSLPSINSVLKKKATGKYTPSETVVAAALQECSEASGLATPSVQKAVWQAKLDEVKSQLRNLRGQMQRAKFSIVLGKKWFPEFPSITDCVLQHKGYTMTFEIGIEKEAI